MTSDTSGWLYIIEVYSSKQLHGPHWSVSEERVRQSVMCESVFSVLQYVFLFYKLNRNFTCTL